MIDSKYRTLATGLMACTFLILAVVAFTAANWQGWDRLIRLGFGAAVFALLCAPSFLLSARRQLLHQISCGVAFAAVGPLIALVGQTYQLGADAYGLFLVWSILGLPAVFASRTRWVWALWLIVVAVGWGFFVQQSDQVSYRNRDGVVLAGYILIILVPLALSEYAVRAQRPNWQQLLWRRVLMLLAFLIGWLAFFELIDSRTTARTLLSFLTFGASVLIASSCYRFRRLPSEDRISLALIGLYALVILQTVLLRLLSETGIAIIGMTFVALLVSIGSLAVLVLWFRHEVKKTVNPTAVAPAKDEKQGDPERQVDAGFAMLIIGASIVVGTLALVLIAAIIFTFFRDFEAVRVLLIGIGAALLAPIAFIRLRLTCVENIAQISMMAVFSAFAAYGVGMMAAGLFVGADFDSLMTLGPWIAFWLLAMAYALWVAPHSATKAIAVGGPLLAISLPFVILVHEGLRLGPLLLIPFELIVAGLVWLHFSGWRSQVRDQTMIVLGLLIGLGAAWVSHNIFDARLLLCTAQDAALTDRSNLHSYCPTGLLSMLGWVWLILPRLLLVGVICFNLRKHPVSAGGLTVLSVLGSLQLAVAATLLLISLERRWWGWVGFAALGFVGTAIRFYFEAHWAFLGTGLLLLIFAMLFGLSTIINYRKIKA